MLTTAKIPVKIRWFATPDMTRIVEIENAVFHSPWTLDDFLNVIRQRNCVGILAYTEDETIAGFAIYELYGDCIHLIDFAVAPEFQRSGVGSALIANIKGKLQYGKKTKIVDQVRETNLKMQLFLRSHGFEAIGVERCVFSDTGEDAFRFIYDLESNHDNID